MQVSSMSSNNTYHWLSVLQQPLAASHSVKHRLAVTLTWSAMPVEHAGSSVLIKMRRVHDSAQGPEGLHKIVSGKVSCIPLEHHRATARLRGTFVNFCKLCAS
jgi:hypothetical protein